jgi:hypothetical protein
MASQNDDYLVKKDPILTNFVGTYFEHLPETLKTQLTQAIDAQKSIDATDATDATVTHPVVVCSQLLRTYQTAEYFFKQVLSSQTEWNTLVKFDANWNETGRADFSNHTIPERYINNVSVNLSPSKLYTNIAEEVRSFKPSVPESSDLKSPITQPRLGNMGNSWYNKPDMDKLYKNVKTYLESNTTTFVFSHGKTIRDLIKHILRSEDNIPGYKIQIMYPGISKWVSCFLDTSVQDAPAPPAPHAPDVQPPAPAPAPAPAQPLLNNSLNPLKTPG